MNISLLYILFCSFISTTIFSKEIVVSDTLKVKQAGEAFLKGYYLDVAHKKDSAYFYYKTANEIYRSLNDSLMIGQTLTYLAILESDLGDYTSSDITAIEALKFLPKDKTEYLTSVYNCLAISSRKQEDFKEALYWYDKAIAISTNKSNTIKYLQNKANAYRDLNAYENAINLLDSLNTLEIKSRKTKARILDNLAYTKWLNGEASIINDLEAALKMRQTEQDTWGLIASYAHLSEVYKKENPTKALGYAKQMYGLAIKSNSPQDQLEALNKIIALDNSKKLKDFYARYLRINDSLNKAENKAKNKYAKLKFDSEKNREDNLQLKITNAKKELALQKEKTINIAGSVASGFTLLLFLGFMYYRKQQYKQEKRAEVYQTETSIAKKIHDEVANNVVNIMNRVQYIEEPKENLLDDLEKVYLLTRNISHQNKAIETGENYTIALKSLLNNFNSSTTTIILKNISNVGLENLSETKQIEIYRVLQELLVNMQKHSKAKLVALSFEKEKGNISIMYSDNGVGVALNSLELKNGLVNMETRIKSINGIITFTSTLNKGFKAIISFK
ncbi:tetratricopeptide repeat-containing sensor histidine kinase [Lutibacter agarilyticus]|nr:tetratricopeptide repeat-containing sensor histidine kinase [Lutibacter agarilyticus]